MRTMICLLVLFTGCSGRKEETPEGEKSGIQKAVNDFATADYLERYHHVVDGERLRERMKSHYADMPRESGFEKAAVVDTDLPGKDKAIVKAELTVKSTGKLISQQYYLRKINGTWLIDWPATGGVNDTPIKVWKADTKSGPISFRVQAEISDDYGRYGHIKDAFYSFRLSDQDDSFVVFSDRGSKVGKELSTVLKDGQKHKLILNITGDADQSHLVEIVSRNWFAD